MQKNLKNHIVSKNWKISPCFKNSLMRWNVIKYIMVYQNKLLPIKCTAKSIIIGKNWVDLNPWIKKGFKNLEGKICIYFLDGQNLNLFNLTRVNNKEN